MADINKERKLSLTSNIIWNMAGNVLYLFSQWTLTIIIARIAGYDELGVFSLAMSISNVGFTIAAWGIRNYQVSDVAHKYSDTEYLYTRVATSIIAFGGVVAFAFICDYSGRQRLAIALYMLFRIGEALIDVFHGMLQQRERMDVVGKSFMLRGAFNFLIFFMLLYLTGSIIWAITGIVLSTVIVMAVWDYGCVKKLEIRTNRKKPMQIHALMWECMPLAIQQALFNTYATIPRFLLERIHGEVLLGIYSSITTPVVIIQAMANFIMVPYATQIARNVSEKNKGALTRSILVVLSAITGTGLLAAGFFFLFGEYGLALLFGDEVAREHRVLLPSVGAIMLVAYDSFLNIILIVFRQKRALVFANICSVICSIIWAESIISEYGLSGTSYVHILALLTHLIITGAFTIREIRRIQ